MDTLLGGFKAVRKGMVAGLPAVLSMAAQGHGGVL